MLTKRITQEQLKQLAHSTRCHLEFLKKQEGALPPRDAQLLKLARDIEASFQTVWMVID